MGSKFNTEVRLSDDISVLENKKSTLHETTSKSFSRTPKGLIFTKDVKDVYSLMLICLDLSDKAKRRLNNPFSTFSNGYFTFCKQEAIQAMSRLNINVEMKSTSISISYSIKSEMANQLLKLFMTAKLLHTPADRTRNDIKDKIGLQPTPKGVSILQKYVKEMGIRVVPGILYSDLNSSRLFEFERSSVTDRIIYNEYFINLLFVKMMGSKPNVWEANDRNDKLPTLGELLEYNDNTFSFECMDFTNGVTDALMKNNKLQQEQQNNELLLENVSDKELHNKSRVSPLAHKFFTNPDSDSHVQYYTTGSGLREFSNRQFGKKPSKLIAFTFTSKAMFQWIMDCTDTMYPKEAITIAALMFKNGLIVPVTGSPSESTTLKFAIGKNYYYTLSSMGCKIVSWNKELVNGFYYSLYGSYIKDDASSESSILEENNNKKLEDEAQEKTLKLSLNNSNLLNVVKQMTLTETLCDPGIRFLFKTHLERELCVENLDAYIEVKKFLKKIKLLKTLIDSRVSTQINKDSVDKFAVASKTKRVSKPSSLTINSTINNALIKEADECLSIVYHIYSTYITVGAPRQLNIDFVLREKVTAIVLHSDSPITENYKNSLNADSLGRPSAARDALKITLKTLTEDDKEETLNIKNCTTLKRVERPAALNLGLDEKLLPNVENAFESDDIIQDQSVSTPTDEMVGRTMKTLKSLYPLFEEVNKKLFKIMETDSFPKFLETASF